MTAAAQKNKLTSGLLLAAVGSIAFSGQAIIVKLAYRHGIDAVTLLMLRMLFAFPLFLAMALWAGRGQAAMTRQDWFGIVGLGFTGYYLSSYLDFLGLEYISASFERLILYLNPTLVLVLGWWVYQRQINPRQVLAMAVSYSGVLLVFAHELSWTGANVWLGSGLVFCSAVTYAIYLTYSGQLVHRLGSLRLAGWASSVACIFCLVQFALFRPLSLDGVAPQVLGLSLLNAIACTVLPVLLVMMAIERIGPGLTAQTGMIGPMSTVSLGVLLLDEPFNGWIITGTILVVSGVFWVTRAARV